jgi:hypothetical protein
MNGLRWVYRHILNSVPFGISLMVLTAVYIAVGSGVPSLREWLEMDELMFFNWWPLKLLMLLLVVNLTIVSVNRIPLTMPRYGVWCVHIGIILLIMSLSAHYMRKVEGLAFVPMGFTQRYFYDRFERSIFVKSDLGRGIATLPSLPRFNAYGPEAGDTSRLDRTDLQGITPMITSLDRKTFEPRPMPLHEALQLPDPITFSVEAYYDYGTLQKWDTTPTGTETGIRVSLERDPESMRWLVGSSSLDRMLPVGGRSTVEHRHLPTKADVDVATAAADQVHKLQFRVGDKSLDFVVRVGEEVVVGETGYRVMVEGFTPDFPLSDGSGSDDMLTLRVFAPAGSAHAEFRRTTLSRTGTQTDFILGQGGPFGARQKELLDSSLEVRYAFSDPTNLMPSVGGVESRYILFTSSEMPGMTMLRTSNRRPPVKIVTDQREQNLQVTAPAPMTSGDAAEELLEVLKIERVDRVEQVNRVALVPSANRNRDEAAGGAHQVAMVRIRSGDWSTLVPVPWVSFAFDQPTWAPWSAPTIRVPGAEKEFQLALGNTLMQMPMNVRLDRFDAIPYAGASASATAIMRDFKSTLTIFDTENDKSSEMSASLNKPAFIRKAMPGPIPDESWILSQARWDPNMQQFTVLQVGNRPAVGMMTFACGLIVFGLLYAFYVKPIIIRRMKRNALAKAQSARDRHAARPTDSTVQPA